MSHTRRLVTQCVSAGCCFQTLVLSMAWVFHYVAPRQIRRLASAGAGRTLPQVPLENTHIVRLHNSLLPSSNGTYGLSTVDCNLECLAGLSHPNAAQCADPLDQYGG